MQHENPFKSSFIHIYFTFNVWFFWPISEFHASCNAHDAPDAFSKCIFSLWCRTWCHCSAFPSNKFQNPEELKNSHFSTYLQFVKIGLILEVLLRLFFAYKGGATHGWIDQVLLQQEANGALIDFFSTSFFQYEDTLLCTLNYTHPPKHQEDFHSLKGAFKWLH